MGPFAAYSLGISWIVYVWFALLILAGASMVLRAVWAPMHARRGATCGACGYELTRLDAPCPECGANPIKAGVLTPAALVRNRGSMFQLTIGWLMVVGGIATPTWTLIATAAAQAQQRAMMIGFSGPQQIEGFTVRPDTQNLHAHLGAFPSSFTMHAFVDASDPERAGAIRFDLERVGEADDGAVLTNSDEGWSLTTEWGDPIAEHETLTPELARRFFESAGYDITTDDISMAIEGLPQLAEAYRADPNHQPGMTEGSRFSVTSSWSDGRAFRAQLGPRFSANAFGRGDPPPRGERPDPPESREWRIEADLDITLDEWKRPASGTITLVVYTEDGGEATAVLDVPGGGTTIRAEGTTTHEADAFTTRESVLLFESAGLERHARNASASIKGLTDLVRRLLEGDTNVWMNSGMGAGYTVDDVRHGAPAAAGGRGPGGSNALALARWGTLGGAIAVYLVGLAVLARLRLRLFSDLRRAQA